MSQISFADIVSLRNLVVIVACAAAVLFVLAFVQPTIVRGSNGLAIQARAAAIVAAVAPARDGSAPLALRSVALAVADCVRDGDHDSALAAHTGRSRMSAGQTDSAANGLVERCAERTWFSYPHPVSASDTSAVNAWLSRLSLKPGERY